MQEVVKLSFEVHESEVQFGGKPMALLTPVVLIDERPLAGEAVPTVDTVQLLTRGKASGEVDLYTCTCGEPGCNGYFRGVTINVPDDGTAVTWEVPTAGYARDIAESMGPGPWKLVFDRTQYESALDSLEALLLEREQAKGKAEVSPCDERYADDEDDSAHTPLAALLLRTRQRFAREQKIERRFRECFADMAEQGVELRIGSSSYWVSMWLYATTELGRQGMPVRYEEDEDLPAQLQALARAAESMRQDPRQAVIDLSREERECCFRPRDEAAGKWIYRWPELPDLQDKSVEFVVRIGSMPA